MALLELIFTKCLKLKRYQKLFKQNTTKLVKFQRFINLMLKGRESDVFSQLVLVAWVQYLLIYVKDHLKSMQVVYVSRSFFHMFLKHFKTKVMISFYCILILTPLYKRSLNPYASSGSHSCLA